MVVKFRAHETFFIRKGWINKGMKSVIKSSDVFVSKDNNPMDVLGIGANMVKSLRYWLQALDLTTENASGKRIQTLTTFGKVIFDNDRYTEELGTLYLLHYKLATNKTLATSWYYFYNEFNMSEFTQDDFVQGIKGYLSSIDEVVPVIRTLEDDFNCIINTYLPRYKSNPDKVSPENNIDCPLGELGLIDILEKKGKKTIYKKSNPASNSFDPWVILAIIVNQANGNTEVRINDLLTLPCNIGKIFNMDAITLLDVLHEVEKTGVIKIIRTSGLDVIHFAKSVTFDSCVDQYYNNMK